MYSSVSSCVPALTFSSLPPTRPTSVYLYFGSGLAAGTIVATAADCGMAWLVEDGITGVLIDADDSHAVRARLTSLASDVDATAAMKQRARDFAAALVDESRSGWQNLTPLEGRMRVEQVR